LDDVSKVRLNGHFPWRTAPVAQIKPNTVDEALAAWDRGDEVETVEMGGMGLGYETAIQCVVFELLRGIRADEGLEQAILATPKGERFPPEVSDKLDALTHAADAKDPETGKYKLGGLSGAQADAAQNLALILVKRGFEAARREVPDRLIFVRKQDPTSLYDAEEAA
jgi:hypothetical protein